MLDSEHIVWETERGSQQLLAKSISPRSFSSPSGKRSDRPPLPSLPFRRRRCRQLSGPDLRGQPPLFSSPSALPGSLWGAAQLFSLVVKVKHLSVQHATSIPLSPAARGGRGLMDGDETRPEQDRPSPFSAHLRIHSVIQI